MSTTSSFPYWASIISFLLGLLSTSVVEFFKGLIKKKRIRRLTVFTCNHYIDNTLPQLKQEYLNLRGDILENKVWGRRTKLMEDFSPDVFKHFSAEEYFKTFDQDFLKIDEARCIMTVLQKDLPHPLGSSYILTINEHLESKKIYSHEEGIIHINGCEYCKLKVTDTTRKIDNRISDIQEVINRLKYISDRHGFDLYRNR